MRRLAVSLLLGTCFYLLGSLPHAYCQSPPPDSQITTAVKAAPEELQEGARVLGFDDMGRYVALRAGSNQLVCLADDPSDDRFHVACYHESLEAFMARGRELRADGLSRAAVDSVRLAEIRAGELSMPDRPVALYSLSGSADTTDASRLHVVYVPYATGESTGLPTRPSGQRPWLMEPGKPWAHIMISSGP